MVKSRWWLINGSVALGLSLPTLGYSAAPLSPQETAQLVEQLHSDQYQERDAAFVTLVQHGQSALAPLVEASVSRDPEIAWRAGEALQLVCRTIEPSAAETARKELTQLSKSPEKAVAAMASTHLKRWPQYRHEHAAGQLEMLGAKVGQIDFSQQAMASEAVEIDGGVMFGGGPILAEVMPAVERLLEAPIIIEEEVEALPEEPVEPAEKPKAGGGMLGGLFRALGRVAVKVEGLEDARAEAAVRLIEAKLSAPRREADVEVLEAPPDVAPMLEPFDVPAFEDGFEAVPAVEEIALVEMVADAIEVGEPSGISPGTLLLDKSWRGADDGLVHATQLQQIYSVTLRQAMVTDRALEHLRNIKSLSRLEVQGTQITGAGLQKLKRERPQLEIVALGAAVLGVAGADHPQGVHVQEVMAETGARRAGIDEGDVVTRMNELPIRTFNDLTLSLYDKQPGETVRIEYLRGGKKHTANVVLTARAELPPQMHNVQQIPQQWAVPHRGRFLPPGGFFGGFDLMDR